jgi:hypothetical protein
MEINYACFSRKVRAGGACPVWAIIDILPFTRSPPVPPFYPLPFAALRLVTSSYLVGVCRRLGRL